MSSDHGHGHAFGHDRTLGLSALGLSAWQRAARLLGPLLLLWLGVLWALGATG
jgi:hypothetical protein